MARVKADANYEKYLEVGKVALELPDFEANSMGYLVPFTGEVFCRAKGCTNNTKFTSLNNLRKHILSKHNNDYDLLAGKAGGRPSQQDEAEAIAFYKTVVEEYERRQAEIEPVLPPLPVKKDGTIHITAMKKAVREQGYTIPCETCKGDNAKKECCTEGRKGQCEHFELFNCESDDEESENEETEEGQA